MNALLVAVFAGADTEWNKHKNFNNNKNMREQALPEAEEDGTGVFVPPSAWYKSIKSWLG